MMEFTPLMRALSALSAPANGNEPPRTCPIEAAIGHRLNQLVRFLDTLEHQNPD